jgi:ABC-type branched-subunit amino acid transport system ATPase component
LKIASDRRDRLAWLTCLVYPGREPLSPAVQASVAEFGLEKLMSSLPPELSQAQRRLVGVARAVASQPSILMLDEPGAGLDEAESARLAHLVRRLARERNMGVLIIEHDVSFVMTLCDRVLVMERGRKLAEGTPSEIRYDPRVISSYLGESQQPATHDGTEVDGDSREAVRAAEPVSGDSG